jgi:hypothetical protein
VQFGDDKQEAWMFGAGEKFMKRKLLYALGSLYVCLINYDLWGRNSCAEFTQSALSPLSFLPLTKGPHETENSSSSPVANSFLLDQISSTESSRNREKGQTATEVCK